MNDSHTQHGFLERISHVHVNWADIQHKLSDMAHRHPVAIARIKDTFDKTLVILSLPFILPLFVLIALAIKAESRGPVFFTQERTGLNAKIFKIYKFRTMTDDACKNDDAVVQSQKKDLRHTQVGRFLRRLSIDELPQLLNVLKGDMSLIGPRPHARYHDELFLSINEDYAKRFRVKPGLTGWAQVNKCRGLIENAEQVRLRTQYDNEYIDHWSLRKEIMIMFKTVLIVICGDNM